MSKYKDINGNPLEVGYTTTYSAHCGNVDGILWVEDDGKHVFQALVISKEEAVEIRGDGHYTYPFPLHILEDEQILNSINFSTLLGICIG